MKLRVKCVSCTNPAVIFQTSPQSTLRSLKQQVIEIGLAHSETCELSLNRTEALNEDCTFQDLGIVSGDLIYILHHGNNDIPAESEEESCSRAIDSDCSSVESQKASTVCSGTQPTMTTVTNDDRVYSISSDTSHDCGTNIESSSCKLLMCDEMNSQITTSFTHYDELCQHGSVIISSSHDIGSETVTPTLTLCVALNTLMLDSGYSLTEGRQHNIIDVSSARWSYNTAAISDRLIIQLACIKMGPLLSVHAMTMVQQQRLTLSLTLNISSYIIENEGTVHYSLKRPVELAQVFKDNIAHKLLTDIRKALGLPEIGTFTSLFPELKLLVCRRLDVKSLISLSSINKELNSLCQDNYLWKYLIYRDFRSVIGVLRNRQTWKQLYIEQYKALMEREKRERQFSVDFNQDHWPILPPLYPSLRPFPPGITGGDYDLLPNVSLQPHRPHPLQHIIPQQQQRHDISSMWNSQLKFPTRRSLTGHFRF